jgi:hypothetical protein
MRAPKILKRIIMYFNKIKTFAAMGAAIVLLASCDKEEAGIENTAQNPSVEDAVVVIEESLHMQKGGELKEIALQNENMKSSGNGVISSLECDVPFDTTLTYYLSGSATGMYTHNWNLLLECSQAIPQSLGIQSIYEGSFEGNNLTRSVEGERNWMWTHLEPTFSERILNGNTYREGVRSLLVGNQNTRTWNLTTVFTDVAVDKESNTILSGSGELSGGISNSNGNTFTFEGTITFNGDGTAILVLNGNTYEIQVG